MSLSFDRPAGTTGVEIQDPVERRQYTLETPRPVDPTPVPTDRFVFPVERAVEVRAEELRLPTVVATYVRDAGGGLIAEAEHFASFDLPRAEYVVELCAPVKCYLRVEAPLAVEADASRMTIAFDGETEVSIGARSHHEQPEATVTTTGQPRDVMAAISTFGSALKTTTVERSYPTLRGHPPAVELGEELSIPEGLEPPDTGVRIEVPCDRRYAYVVSSLAYYLGAEVVPGRRPRLVTDTGFVHELDGLRGFEGEVERVLKQTFFLDCLTRTEGLYEVDLHERRALEGSLPLDFESLYGRSLAEQLQAYLAVPYDVVEEYVPEWKLTTHVDPGAEHVEVLPFVVDDLAAVRTPAATRAEASEVAVDAVGEFVRSADASGPGSGTAGVPSLVEPEPADSLEQAWVGEAAPIGASKATASAFRNKLAREPTEGDLEIGVVCNDPEMAAEHDAVGTVYGSHDQLPFAVDLHRELTVAELRDVLRSDLDFLHYVGHIDEAGFECADGKLDAREFEGVAVDAFLLNACSSYEQGMALIEAGAIGGVVTLAEVLDSEAVGVGKNVARLLDHGFSIRAALSVASDQSLIGSQYLVLGDGNFDIAQSEGRTACLLDVESADGEFVVTHKTFPSNDASIGSMTKILGEDGTQYLYSGTLKTYEADASHLEDLLAEDLPVQFDGELLWGDTVLDRIRVRTS